MSFRFCVFVYVQLCGCVSLWVGVFVDLCMCVFMSLRLRVGGPLCPHVFVLCGCCVVVYLCFGVFELGVFASLCMWNLVVLNVCIWYRRVCVTSSLMCCGFVSLCLHVVASSRLCV